MLNEMFRGQVHREWEKEKVVEMHVNLFNEFHFQEIFENIPAAFTKFPKAYEQSENIHTQDLALHYRHLWRLFWVYFVMKNILLFSFSTLKNAFAFSNLFSPVFFPNRV